MKGLIVNKLGQRFVAEDSYHARTSGFVMEQPDSAAYLIVDSEHVEHPKMPLVPFIDGWETVEEMEAGLGLPAGSLVATLARYNEHAARGEDPDFHKSPDWLAPQDTGPWGAYDLTLGNALYAGFTLGGIRTTVDGEVQRPDGIGRSPACTPPAPARPTSPRTARGTRPAPSSARGRSSGGGRGGTLLPIHWLTREMRTCHGNYPCDSDKTWPVVQ